MGRLPALIVFTLLLCFSFPNVKAQNSTRLRLGTPIERAFAAGQQHEFTVEAEENSFVQLEVEQRGIDVVVKVSAPDGKSLGEYDTPNGAQGPEHVSFVAITAGTYHINISALDRSNAPPGRYQIKLDELRRATEQELNSIKNKELVKEKGVALLLELDGAIAQIKSPHIRLQAQLKAAKLLREFDAKRAAKYLTDATEAVKELLSTVDVESDEYIGHFSEISQLRFSVIQALAEFDPDAALNFLRSTTPRYAPYGNKRDLMVQESGLELSIANQIVENDPKRAVQIARQILKKGYNSNLLGVASVAAQKNSELASELMREITSKLLAEDKLVDNQEAANLTLGLLNSYPARPQGDVQYISPNQAPSLREILSEEEYKQLLQKALNEVLSYKVTAGHPYNRSSQGLWSLMSGLKSLGPALDKVVSGSAAALEKKQAEIQGNHPMLSNPVVEFYNAISNSSVDAALETLEKAPPEFREQLYIQLANKEASNGELARARQIVNEHVSDPFQRRQALTNIEQQEIYRATSSGKIEDALSKIGKLPTPRQRASQMFSLVSQLGPEQKRATALSLLEQARSMLAPSPQAQDMEQMGALIEIARAFSYHDSKRSFEIIDPLIEQFNELCMAARILEGFGTESFEGEELSMQNGNAVAQIAEQLSSTLGSLALENFERAKASSDKFRLPEVRLKAYLEIAQQTIEGVE